MENLKAVGVKAQINKFDINTVIQKGKKGEFDLLMLGYSMHPDPDRNTSGLIKTGVEFNLSAYSSAEMDALLQQGVIEIDPAKRHVIYDKVQELWVKDMPLLNLYSQLELGAVSKKVKAAEPKVKGMLINVQEWDIEN